MEKKVELLLPAGNIEKLDYAINYGADAIYMGMVDFSLRTMRKGDVITAENLKKAIDLAHSYNKKVYMTLNIYAYDDDIAQLYKNIIHYVCRFSGVLSDAITHGLPSFL